ncbi:MAG: photosystem II assembly protein PufX [Rhodobacteraceae bacterium HLUCCA08]|nr:MAG: photosystem II assembly protein PufX [Rhodobacteraceae bacterium HLUCCA08]
MADDNDMLQLGRRGQLTANVTYLMLKGAGYAAAVVLVVWLGIAFLGWFGSNVLPEDSRFTPDPINRSDLVIDQAATRIG